MGVLKCSNCGAEVMEDDDFCKECGIEFEDAEDEDTENNIVDNKTIKNSKGSLSISILVAGIIGCIVLFFAGVHMTSLESQSGESLAEVFYNDMGYVVIGLSIVLSILVTYISKRIDK